MNIFEAVKTSVTTREAAETYGIRVNRKGMCCCPFHRDKHPSMKVDKRFHCFGCGEDGGVLEFTAKYFDLSIYDAARKLAEDFQVSYDHSYTNWNRPVGSVQAKLRKKSPEQVYREKEKHFFQVISDYHHLLKHWKEEYKPALPDGGWDEHYTEALNQLPKLEYVMDQFLSASRQDREELFIVYHNLEQYCADRLKDTENRGVIEAQIPVGMRGKLHSVHKAEKACI